MSGHANPDEETTDWRAVCGRTACTVRRAGRARALSDPYQQILCQQTCGYCCPTLFLVLTSRI